MEETVIGKSKSPNESRQRNNGVNIIFIQNNVGTSWPSVCLIRMEIVAPLSVALITSRTEKLHPKSLLHCNECVCSVYGKIILKTFYYISWEAKILFENLKFLSHLLQHWLNKFIEKPIVCVHVRFKKPQHQHCTYTHY